MKYIFTILLLLVVSFVGSPLCAQPVITFLYTEFDCGKISESGGDVTAIFVFRNDGDEDLVITNCQASCACINPTWETVTVRPHSAGQISATYNPIGRPGRFQKSIAVSNNATLEPVKIYFKGEVIADRNREVQSPKTFPCMEGLADTETYFMEFGFGEGSNSSEAMQNAMDYAVKNLATRLSNGNPSEALKKAILFNASHMCRNVEPTPSGMVHVYIAIQVSKSAVR